MASGSCGLKESCTSSALGRAMRSGSVQRALRLQMELSRTRRASRSSEKTMLSLPIAVPAGQRALASSSDPSKAATKPPSISLASSACKTSGCSSARFQLPSQCRSAGGARSSSGISAAGGHCLLAGRGPKAPVGTPCCMSWTISSSGSLVAVASSCSSWSRKGWSGAMLRHSGEWQCGCRQACAMVAACRHSFSERGCSGRPCMRCAEMRLGRSRLCAHVSQAWRRDCRRLVLEPGEE